MTGYFSNLTNQFGNWITYYENGNVMYLENYVDNKVDGDF